MAETMPEVSCARPEREVARVVWPVAVRVVKVPAAGVEPPMMVPSIVPSLISAVVATSDGVVRSPVEEMVVEAVCPAAKVFAVSVDVKRFVEVAFVMMRFDGRERVTEPSPSSATVI